MTVFGARKKFSHFAKKLLDIVPTAWYYNKRSKRAAVCAGQKIEYALLAQLDRVFGYEPKGQGFESLRAHHYIGKWLNLVEHLVWDQGVAGSNPVFPTI